MSKSSRVLMFFVMLVCTLVTAGCAVTEQPSRVVVREEPLLVREAPPPDREEVIVEAPSPRHVWVKGYWTWHDGWVWQPGHWSLPPYGGAQWVPGHWRQRPYGWVWVSGHWR